MKKLLWALAFLFLASTVFAQVPDQSATVRRVSLDYAIGTPAGLEDFVDASVCALHALDSRWGHLRKSGPQTQIHGHAHDGALYLSDTPGQSQFVDYVSAAGAPNASIGWGVDLPRYSRSDWLPPHNCAPVPAPEPPPPAVDLSQVNLKLDELANLVRALSLQIEAATDAATSARLIAQSARDRIEDTLTAVDLARQQINRPPIYSGGFLGIPITLRPTVHPANPMNPK